MTRNVTVLDDAEAVAGAVAALVADAIAARPAVGIALAGGTTPRRAYELCAAHVEDVRGVHVWFGDERMVDAAHPDANHGMVVRAWPAIAGANVHRIRGELGAIEAARNASDELRAVGGDAPRLDLVVLGVGADGHTASLFPGDPAVDLPGLYVPAVGGARVSLALPVLNAARRVVFVVTGAAKSASIARIFDGSGSTLPAARVAGEDIRWVLDRAAMPH
jgi:6-phosphogluconolactonase